MEYEKKSESVTTQERTSHGRGRGRGQNSFNSSRQERTDRPYTPGTEFRGRGRGRGQASRQHTGPYKIQRRENELELEGDDSSIEEIEYDPETGIETPIKKKEQASSLDNADGEMEELMQKAMDIPLPKDSTPGLLRQSKGKKVPGANKKFKQPKKPKQKKFKDDEDFEDVEDTGDAEDGTIHYSQFYNNFEDSMIAVLDEMMSKSTEERKNYYKIVKRSYIKNTSEMKTTKSNLRNNIRKLSEEKKKKVQMMKEQKKKIMSEFKEEKQRLQTQIDELSTTRKGYTSLYKEFLFFNREPIREKNWRVTTYEETKISNLDYVPFNTLASFYRKRFPEDKKEILINSSTRNMMNRELSFGSCKKCFLISHPTEKCTSE